TVPRMDRPTVRHRGRLPKLDEVFDTSSADSSSADAASATLRTETSRGDPTRGNALTSFSLRGSPEPAGQPLEVFDEMSVDEMSDTSRRGTWRGRAAGAGIALGVLAVPSLAWAQATEAHADSGDTAWMLVSAALVLLMTPGLALFYGGMVRRKNVLATLMYSHFALALVTIQWVLFGYSLTFGKTHHGLIGGF